MHVFAVLELDEIGETVSFVAGFDPGSISVDIHHSSFVSVVQLVVWVGGIGAIILMLDLSQRSLQ